MNDELTIGILCYKDTYLKRIINWVDKLKNKEKIHLIVYHDNIGNLPDWFQYELEASGNTGTNVIEPNKNLGMYGARKALMRECISYFPNSFLMMCDDDDLVPSDIWNRIFDNPSIGFWGEIGCIFPKFKSIETKEHLKHLLETDSIFDVANSRASGCYCAWGTIFNPYVLSSYLDFIDYTGIVESEFQGKIQSGEDMIFIKLYQQYMEFHHYYKRFSSKVHIFQDNSEDRAGRYEGVSDYRYANTEDTRDEELKKFFKKYNKLSREFNKLLEYHFNKFNEKSRKKTS